MMKVLLVSLTCLLAASGCLHHAEPTSSMDFAARTLMLTMASDFIVQGRVVSGEHHGPVAHAEVFFRDMGLDYSRAKTPWERRIGTADEWGQLDQGFEYGWCKELSFNALGISPPNLDLVNVRDRGPIWRDALVEAWDHSARSELFAIEIRKEGYKTYRADFDLAKLPNTELPYTLNLGTIVLERAPAADPSH